MQKNDSLDDKIEPVSCNLLLRIPVYNFRLVLNVDKLQSCSMPTHIPSGVGSLRSECFRSEECSI